MVSSPRGGHKKDKVTRRIGRDTRSVVFIIMMRQLNVFSFSVTLHILRAQPFKLALTCIRLAVLPTLIFID